MNDFKSAGDFMAMGGGGLYEKPNFYLYIKTYTTSFLDILTIVYGNNL